MRPILRVQHLSKLYRLGERRDSATTLRDALAEVIRSPLGWLRRKWTPPNSIWALKDVDLEVEPGEVVGVIGRNGAGKSTLLKLLSRIAEPTVGRIELYGRVGSLLEVGTGFHHELSGRDNIFLSGAILGMKRREVARKFDEIVAFAEVERFIDTPVKRYSTGMYLRLAFAVAAHLEPAILLVDEVLAVGDADFQKKCLGRMGEVARGGRTVLFVSHNLQAVKSLCSRVVRLEAGRVAEVGDPGGVIGRYLGAAEGLTSIKTWPESVGPGNEELRLTSVQVHSGEKKVGRSFSSGSPVFIELEFISRTQHPGLCVGFDLTSSEGVVVARSYQTDMAPPNWPVVRLGKNRWRCVIPEGLLNGGVYGICPRIGIHNISWIVHEEAVVSFEVVLDHQVSPLWNGIGRSRPGVISPVLVWGSEVC